MPHTLPTIAYLARGRLYVRLPNKDSQEVESPFAQQYVERQMRDQELDAWKGRSGVWAGMGLAPPSMTQWQQAGAPGIQQPRIVALTRGSKPLQLLYAISLGNVGGLFRYDLNNEQELRLMHKEGFLPTNLAVHPETDELALAMESEPGNCRLATSKHEGRFLTTVSSGDTVDMSPAWTVAESQQIVFQSARVGRNPQGMAVGLGPYAVRRLEIASGNLETLAISREFDYLTPRMSRNGTLFCIRRPYESMAAKPVRFVDVLLDVLLFPYRLLRTLFLIVNFFSLMVSGKPLANSLGRSAEPTNPYDAMALSLWGRAIDTKKALAENRRTQNSAVVPKSWELIARDTQGKEITLATSVVSFDLLPSGDLVYTNGFSIFHRLPTGQVTTLCHDELIESVVAVVDEP